MGEKRLKAKLLLLSCALGGSIFGGTVRADDDGPKDATEEGVKSAQIEACGDKLDTPTKKRRAPRTRVAKTVRAPKDADRAPASDAPIEREAVNTSAPESLRSARQAFTLDSFFDPDPAKNIVMNHPFVIANAAEKTYALVTHVGARDALDPLYGVKPVKVYPMLAGEHPASGGRMVVGQEEAVHSFVHFAYSAARGDRVGKAVGFPGPAGTGKTELLYTIDQLEKNLGKEDKYKQLSYRFRGLYNVPKLRELHRMIEHDGKRIATDEYFNPDMARSPFTLLRPDMQRKIMAEMPARVRGKWNMLITKGWQEPEPKTIEIMQRIFEHHFPDIERGLMTVDDLTEEEYLSTLNKYVVIVPRALVKPPSFAARVIGAQSENPNFTALFASTNLSLLAKFPESDLSINYKGEFFQQDGQLLMFDEWFRNDQQLLNQMLETVQNHTVQGDVGHRVRLDILPVWNSNDESIQLAGEVGAIKALLDRTDSPPMRSLLQPKQIESIIPFQIGLEQFSMRQLNDPEGKLETKPFVHSEVYPAVDAFGKTETARGRFALYYKIDGVEYLISPWTMNYMAWIASATRAVVDKNKIEKFKDAIDLVGANMQVLFDPIARVQTMIGDKTIEPVHLQTLHRLHFMLKEGAGGISSRDVETWMKEVINVAHASGSHVITPRMANDALISLLESGRIDPGNDNMRVNWSLLRRRVAEELLLPKLRADVRTMISSENNRAEHIYDDIIDEMLRMAHSEQTRDPSELGVNVPRLNKVQQFYRAASGGRDFNVSLIARLLEPGSNRGKIRHPELLAAVREMLADGDVTTSSYVGRFDRFFRGKDDDPDTRQKVADVTVNLAAFGYDRASFEDTVILVAQLEADRNKRKIQSQQR